MAVEVTCTYVGDLRVDAEHGPSGNGLHTDPPTDNGGSGSSFSPTDLVATALGTCVLTVMGLVAERHSVDLKGATVKVTKEMVTSPVRRIGKLTTRVVLPAAAVSDPDMRTRLEAAARHCPVHQSLRAEIELPMEFRYE